MQIEGTWCTSSLRVARTLADISPIKWLVFDWLYVDMGVARRRECVYSPGKTINPPRSRISLSRRLGMCYAFCILVFNTCHHVSAGNLKEEHLPFVDFAPVSAVHLKDQHSPFVGVKYVGDDELISLARLFGICFGLLIYFYTWHQFVPCI